MAAEGLGVSAQPVRSEPCLSRWVNGPSQIVPLGLFLLAGKASPLTTPLLTHRERPLIDLFSRSTASCGDELR